MPRLRLWCSATASSRCRSGGVRRFGWPRRGSATDSLITSLSRRPRHRRELASEASSASATPGRERVLALEAAGILRQVNVGRRRSRAWEAAEMIDLLDDFEFESATPTRDNEPRRPSPRRRLQQPQNRAAANQTGCLDLGRGLLVGHVGRCHLDVARVDAAAPRRTARRWRRSRRGGCPARSAAGTQGPGNRGDRHGRDGRLILASLPTRRGRPRCPPAAHRPRRSGPRSRSPGPKGAGACARKPSAGLPGRRP